MDALNDYIILLKDKNDLITKSGIILPDFGSNPNEVAPPYSGVVLSVGWNVSHKYRIGDKLLFNELCQPYLMDTEDGVVVIIRECDVVGTLKKD